jgi:DNA polymerase V
MTETSIGTGISFISAGFPSPAEDFTELSISLDKHLIQNAAATFMAYANGNSMARIGIHHGDLLIIDRSLNARDGDVIIALLYGEFLIKQVSIVKGILFLVPKNPQYLPVRITSEMEFEVWGVVTCSIRMHR